MSGEQQRKPGSGRVVGPGFHERVYRIVRRIPKGSVATYGQIAEMLGHPGVSRHVGYALAVCERALQPVPWHRVGTASGKIATPGARQRVLLVREGVTFTPGGMVQLARHRWQRQVTRPSRGR